MRSLAYLNAVLTVIAVLLTALLWTAATGTSVSFVPSASAQGTEDPGAQRAEMISQLRSLNLKVDDLAALWRSGSARVRVIERAAAEAKGR